MVQFSVANSIAFEGTLLCGAKGAISWKIPSQLCFVSYQFERAGKVGSDLGGKLRRIRVRA